MKEMNILEVCRLCLGSGKRLSELTGHIKHIISTCFSINICISSGLTNRICQACVQQIVYMYRYRKKIIKSQQILIKKLRENVANHSIKLYTKNLKKDWDFDQGKDGIVKSNTLNDDIKYTKDLKKDWDFDQGKVGIIKSNNTLSDAINFSDDEIDFTDTNVFENDEFDSKLKVETKNVIKRSSLKDWDFDQGKDGIVKSNTLNDDIKYTKDLKKDWDFDQGKVGIVKSNTLNDDIKYTKDLKKDWDFDQGKVGIVKSNTLNDDIKYTKDLKKDCDFNQGKVGIIKSNNTLSDAINFSDDEIDFTDTNVFENDEFDSKLKAEKKNVIRIIEKHTTEQKEGKPNVVSIESMINDLKGSSKLDEIKTIKTDTVNDLDESLRYEDKKFNNLIAIKTEKKDLHLEENEISTIPVTYESIYDNGVLDIVKEDTDKNIFITSDLRNGKFMDQDIKTDVILNTDDFYVTNMEKKFMCLTCMKIFESQKELSTHYKTVELPQSQAKSVNTSRNNKEPSVVEVSKNDDGNTAFKCGICGKKFKNRISVLKHARVHKVDRPFLCNLCSRTYKTVDDILRHGVVHGGNKYVCSYHCGYTTVHLGALREHVKRHKKEFKYKCETCGKCFQVKTWYDQHQNVHDKVRPFICKLCGQSFSMARYLTAHRANVHPQSSKVKRFMCVQCALPCDSRKTLVMHMKQKHDMKTDCLCDVCGQILPDQQKLSLHKSIHQATRKYSCGFCKKTFNKKDHKTVHEKIHTGERLSCDKCPKSFTQRYSLRRHIKRCHQEDQKTL